MEKEPWCRVTGMGVFKDFLARRTKYFTSPKKKNLDEDWPGWGSFVAAALAPAFLDSPIVFLSLFSFYTEVFCRGGAGTSILGLSYFFLLLLFSFYTRGSLSWLRWYQLFFPPWTHTHTIKDRHIQSFPPCLPLHLPCTSSLPLPLSPPTLSTLTWKYGESLIWIYTERREHIESMSKSSRSSRK